VSARPAITRPTEVIAEAFHRRLKSGRNGALLVSARTQDGASVDCVVKVPGLMENPTLHPLPSLLEWLGAALALELGISVPRPFLVQVTKEFADSVLDLPVAAGLKKSVGAVFGSQFVQGASMLRGDLLDLSLRGPASSLLAFDVFIHNIDRRAKNPNLFHTRDELVAFDHGEAFSFIWTIIGAPDPVTDALRKVVDDHPCTPLLRRKGPLDLDHFREALRALSDKRLSDIAAATPGEWCTGPAQGKLEQILKTIQERRNALDSWLPQVEAWIQPE
jgi:hypothetical protein